jgi:hypothetical protein
MKIIITGLIFLIMNYQSFRNDQVSLYEFPFLWMELQTKIWNILKFQITEFWINQVLLYVVNCKLVIHIWIVIQLHVFM